MEWVGIVTWALVLALALPLAGAGGLVSPWLATQSLLVVGGFTTCLLWVLFHSGAWLLWASFGLTIAAAIAVALGSVRLVSADRPVSAAGQTAEDYAAGFAGGEEALLVPLVGIMLLAALGYTVVT